MVETFSPDTIIVPMDQDFQNNGMFKAYGLVYALLTEEISVKWAIQPNKPLGGTDFTATAEDIRTETPVTDHNYRGGPFIVDSEFAAEAQPIIDQWLTDWPGLNVHRATEVFNANIVSTMDRRPRIAVEFANPGIIFAYLNAASIPDPDGNPWATGSPNVFTAREIGEGALREGDDDLCPEPSIEILLTNQSNDPRWNPPSASVNELNLWLAEGGILLAMSGSIDTYEGTLTDPGAGPFLTQQGFDGFANLGDPGLSFLQTDYPPTQTVRPLIGGEVLPSGPIRSWNTNTVDYNPRTRVLAFFTAAGIQYDFFIGGSFKDGAGLGKVFYQGGQAYSTSMPYSQNRDGSYVRFVLNTILWSIAKPELVLNVEPETVPTAPTTLTYTLDNIGGAIANDVILEVTLPPWASYNDDADSPPISIVGQTITWDLGTVGTGTVLTFTVDVEPPEDGFQEAAEYDISYSDEFFQEYNLEGTCASVLVEEGAFPTVSKEPQEQTVNPNDIISWTITVTNQGSLPLEDITVTDVLPPELTFQPAQTSPQPTTISGGPPDPTTLVWQAPDITDPLGPGESFSIILAAQAPSATTATFFNEVTVVGSDDIPFTYEISETVEVNVENRPPTVNIITPDGEELVCAPGIEINWQASDPDGDPLTYNLSYSPDGGVSFVPIVSGLTDTSFFWDTSGLPSGENYRVRVVASDGVLTGQDISSNSFTIDNNPPEIDIIEPEDSSFISGLISIEAVVTDNINVNRVVVQYSTDGVTFTNIGTITVPDNGDIYRLNWDSETVADGEYILRAEAFDNCDLSDLSDIKVIVDNTPPEVTIVEPEDGDLVKKEISITVSGSDERCLDRVELYIRGELVVSEEVTPPGGLNIDFTFNWNTEEFADGPTPIEVRAIDCAGNVTSETITVIIDNVGPEVSIETPSAGDFLTGTVPIEISASDNQCLEKIELFINNQPIETEIVDPDDCETGELIFQWDTTTVNDGANQIKAVATNWGGNQDIEEIEVIVDNTPPTAEIPFPEDGSTVEGTVIIDIISEDNLCLEKIEVFIDNRLVRTVDGERLTEKKFEVEWDTTEYTEGPHTVTVVATDCVGLTGSTESTFIVDNIPDCFTQIMVNGDLEIPDEKPDIANIVDFNITPDVEKINSFNTIEGTKIVVSGFLDIDLTYVADVPEQTENYANFRVHFSATMVCPEIFVDQILEAVVITEDIQKSIIDSRTISKNIVLLVGVR